MPESLHAYMGLSSRYNNLKAAIDILRDQNTGYLQTVKEIERLYREAVEADDWSKQGLEWKMYTDALQQEAWIS